MDNKHQLQSITSSISSSSHPSLADSVTHRKVDKGSEPLGTCLLIEYRLSLRSRLHNCIASTDLFVNVEEPASMLISLAMIAKQRVDSCIFGPSVRWDKVREFMKQVSESAASTECAFLVTRSCLPGDSIDGVHIVIEFPCSQREFNAAIVGAITKAHGGKLPEAKRCDPQTGRPLLLKDLVSQLQYPGNQSVDVVIKDNRPSLWPRETFDAVLRKSSLLKAKLAELQPFNLCFRTDGSPTEFTSETVLNLIASVFPDADLVPGMPKFKVVLEELIYKWAQTGAQLGRRTADTCLKREIMNCFGLSIQ